MKPSDVASIIYPALLLGLNGGDPMMMGGMGVDGGIAGGGGLELTLPAAPKRQGKAKSITDQLLGSFF